MKFINDEPLISISSLRQFIFCPRIPWFVYVMNFQPPEQLWMTQGKIWHKAQHSLQKRRVVYDLQDPTTCEENVYVMSEKFKFHGYLDELIYNNEECIVIEYKSDTKKPYLGQRLQLLAYVVAVEETIRKKVKAAILVKGSARKQYRINIEEDARQELAVKCQELRVVLSNHRMPLSNASEHQCDQCEYLRYCNDR